MQLGKCVNCKEQVQEAGSSPESFCFIQSNKHFYGYKRQTMHRMKISAQDF